MNASSDRVEPETPKSFDSLLEKATHVHETLGEVYYQSELDHVVEKLQFNIIVMGSPRVGKSELINALCNGKIRAETSLSLDSCTKEVKCYVLEDNQQRNPAVKPFKINFYDTPGIESWGDNAGETSMVEFIKKTDPVCIIYCASPGSFAKLEQLHSVLEYCKAKEIFCALVCTNMWSGNQREMVINEFQKELAFFGDKIDKFSQQSHSANPHKITFFGKGALCTMINSKVYYDPDFSDQRKPVQGVDELIHGIMEALDHDKLLGWCYAVLYRRSYWQKISQKIGGFFSLRLADLYKLVTPSPDGTATNFLTQFHQWFFKKKT
jgi:GTPase Era involved in 16S rRNA processing